MPPLLAADLSSAVGASVTPGASTSGSNPPPALSHDKNSDFSRTGKSSCNRQL